MRVVWSELCFWTSQDLLIPLIEMSCSQKCPNVISVATLNEMQSYLNNRKQRTQVGDKCSAYTSCTAGVPEGSILGSVLFRVYITDLAQACADVNIEMYADDTVIFTHAKTKAQPAAKLIAALCKVSNWFTNSCSTLYIN